jgi:hypothetical protein
MNPCPTSENAQKAKFSLVPYPVLRAYPVRGLNRGGYDYCLMYAGLCALDTLHKIICCIGPGLRIMLQVNFREFSFCALR